MTFGQSKTDQVIYISGNPNTSLKDVDGKPLSDSPADILAHELVGHGIPKALGQLKEMQWKKKIKLENSYQMAKTKKEQQSPLM